MKKERFQIDITDKKYRNLLIVSYAIVAVTVIAVMTLFIFSWFNRYIQNVIYDMSVTQLNNLENSLSYTVDSCRTQLQAAWQEPDIKSHMYSSAEDSGREYRISRYLQNLCVSNGIADYVCVFRDEDDFAYYGSRFPDAEETAQLKEKIYETGSDTEFFLLQDVSKSSICLFITNRDYLGGPPKTGLVYAINLDKLQKQLLSETRGDVRFLILDSDGNALLNPDFSSEDAVAVWEQIQGKEGADAETEIILNQKRFLLNFRYDRKSGIYVIMVQDYQLIRSHIAGMRQTVYLSILFCFFAVLALGVLLANGLYVPLENFFVRLSANPGFHKADDSYIRKRTEMSSEKILSQISTISLQYHTDKVLQYLEGNGETAEIPPVLCLTDRSEQCRLLLYWTDGFSGGVICRKWYAAAWRRGLRAAKSAPFRIFAVPGF